MAQTVIINGVTYSGVPSVKMPLASDPETLAVFPDTSDATAAAGDILTGETAYVNGVLVDGTMPNNGTYSQTITAAAQVVTIPAGYHDGSGTVGIDPSQQALLVPENVKDGVTVLGVTGSPTVNETTLSTTGAAAGDILTGKQAWVTGALVTGSMADNGSLAQTITTLSQVVTLSAGYYAGGTVQIDPSQQALLVPGNLLAGVTILGVTGEADVNNTSLPETGAAAGEILAGAQAWVNGELVTGSMPNNGAYQQTISAVSQTVTIPEGYHDGSGTVEIDTASQEALTPGNILNGVTILGVTGEATVNNTSLPETGATESQILAGSQAWVNGELLDGTMPNNGTMTQTITTPGQVVTLSAGYYAGGTVQIDSADQALLVSGNIKSGVTILGVAGSPNVNDTTLTATAAGAGDLTAGKQAWVNGVLLTGTGTQPSISLSGGVLSIS